MNWLKGCSVSVCALMLIVGCANNPSHSGSFRSSKVKVKKNEDGFNKFEQAYYNKDFKSASEISQNLIETDKHQHDTLLWKLQSGVNAFEMNDYKQSITNLEDVNTSFDNKFKEGATAGGKVLASTLGNEKNIPYRGNVYEWVLANYYLALDYAFLNDMDKARVFFNQTAERQRRAKDYFAKEIAKEQENIKKQEEEAKSKSKGKKEVSAQLLGSLNGLTDKYKSLELMKGYENFSNPLVNYVSGIFYLLNNDKGKAEGYLKEAFAISHSKVVGEDLAGVNKARNTKTTWVIVEDGEQPLLEEVADKDLYFAMPYLKDGGKGTDFKQKYSLNGKDLEVLSNFNEVIKAEFNHKLPSITARAISAAVTKNLLSRGVEAAGKATEMASGSAAGQMVGMGLKMSGKAMKMVNASTTQADTRSSSVFPNKIYAAKLKASDSGVLNADGMKLLDLNSTKCEKTDAQNGKICSNTNNIVFIRTLKTGISVSVLNLK
ncbi:hypothetical protein [Helicobacter pylori]|uniref:hypothetical protein n=1 Tax=Helicobacter pylori TaxID=210 RepID=UPI00040B3435|nr:hypothetical protein [Helicobacter pylori]